MRPEIGRVLDRLEAQSRAERDRTADVAPDDRMLAITADTGIFYNTLLRAAGARRILEIGTSTGYSALWFADAALENGGGVTTIERNPSKARRAEANFEEARVSGAVTVVRGEALDALGDLSRAGSRFDFAFIDADKESCVRYFDAVFPMIRANGVVGTDNMLYPERYRGMMGDFRDHVRAHPGAQTVTVNIGNGQEVTVKTG